MTREQIIQLAHEAGTTFVTQYGVASATPEWLERFATLVAAAEREACAVVAAGTVCDTHIPTGVKVYGALAAKAIRARSAALPLDAGATRPEQCEKGQK